MTHTEKDKLNELYAVIFDILASVRNRLDVSIFVQQANQPKNKQGKANSGSAYIHKRTSVCVGCWLSS